MPVAERIVERIPRNRVRALLDHVTDRSPDGNPRYPVFSVHVARRTPLYLRYNPVSDFQNGPLARVGDHCRLDDRGQNIIRSSDGRSWEITPSDPVVAERHLKGRSPIFLRRNCGDKVILEDVGQYRWMIVKNHDPEARNDTKHHKYVEGGELNYDPAEKELYLVRGFYSDQEKGGRIGRFGQWRPWCQICLRSVTLIRCSDRSGRKMEWHIMDPSVRTPEEYRERRPGAA